jgi:hypothetical protein
MLAIVLILCAQVFAIVSTGNLVLCIHEGGPCAVELVGSECCREAHEAESRAPTRVESATGTVTTPDADRCRDLAWKQDQAPVVRGAHVRTAPSRAIGTVLPAIVAWTREPSFFAMQVARLDVRGPPREAVPRRTRPFIRRC